MAKNDNECSKPKNKFHLRTSKKKDVNETFAVPARTISSIASQVDDDENSEDYVPVNTDQIKVKKKQWRGGFPDDLAADDSIGVDVASKADPDFTDTDEDKAFNRIYDMLEQGVRFYDGTRNRSKATGERTGSPLERGTINIPTKRISASPFSDGIFVQGPISDAEYKLIRLAILGTKARLVPHRDRYYKGIDITNITGLDNDYEMDYDSDIMDENPMHESLSLDDDLRSKVYNALSDICFRYSLKGREITQAEMNEAIEWFETHFWDEVDADDLTEDKTSAPDNQTDALVESMKQVPQFKKKQ